MQACCCSSAFQLNHQNPVAYKIYDGAEYDLRCYQITIEQDPEKATYLLTVTGTLGSFSKVRKGIKR